MSITPSQSARIIIAWLRAEADHMRDPGTDAVLFKMDMIDQPVIEHAAAVEADYVDRAGPSFRVAGGAA